MTPSGDGPRVLAIIPERGGSKSVPRKNVRLLAGHPLIAYSIAAGLVGILCLHLNEYDYHNSLVGGGHGAYRQYDLDHWATSNRRAMERLDEAAPPGARVFVAGPGYLLTYTRANSGERAAPDAPMIFEVRVAGAVLATVRALGRRGMDGIGIGGGAAVRRVLGVVMKQIRPSPRSSEGKL